MSSSTSSAAPPALAPSVTHGKRWLIGAMGGLLVAAGAAAYAEYRHRATPAAPQFETQRVTRGSVQAKVTANGTLSALVTVQVGSQVSGRLQRIDVDFNSAVKKGQTCAQIDPLLFRAAVEQAQANVLAARGNLTRDQAQATNARLQYQRERELGQRQLVAAADVDTAQANAEAAAAQVAADRGMLAQAEAALHQAKVNLDYTTIVSPIDGVVVSRNVDVGQTVAAAFQAPVLFLIAQDLRLMQVDTNVAEADVGRLAPGMETTFTVDAYPNDVFKGVIRQVRKNPQTLQNVVTYDAVIDVRNDDLKLFPGMTANVSVLYADRTDAVLVPNAALRFHPSDELLKARPAPKAKGAERVVWLPDGASARPLLVHLGVSDGTATELLGAELSPGDALITESLARPKAGGPGSYGRVF